MAAGTITVQKGDDASLGLQLSNPDGSAYNATGSTLTMTVSQSATADPVVTKTVTTFTSGGSAAAITFTESDLDIAVRAWRYELVPVDAGGDRRSSGLNMNRPGFGGGLHQTRGGSNYRGLCKVRSPCERMTPIDHRDGA